jgi:hypothetical protein
MLHGVIVTQVVTMILRGFTRASPCPMHVVQDPGRAGCAHEEATFFFFVMEMVAAALQDMGQMGAPRAQKNRYGLLSTSPL